MVIMADLALARVDADDRFTGRCRADFGIAGGNLQRGFVRAANRQQADVIALGFEISLFLGHGEWRERLVDGADWNQNPDLVERQRRMGSSQHQRRDLRRQGQLSSNPRAPQVNSRSLKKVKPSPPLHSAGSRKYSGAPPIALR